MPKAKPVEQIEPKSNLVEVKGPDEKQNTETVDRFLVSAQDHAIVDTQSLQEASDMLLANRKMQKTLDAERTELVAPLNEVVKKINAKFKPWSELLQYGEKLLRGKIATYQNAEQLRLRKEQAAAEEKARKDRAALEAKADKLREDGKVEKAAVLEQKAAATVAVVAEAPKVSGIVQQQVWSGRITDMKAFCGGIATGEIPEDMVEAKQANLNRLALMYKTTRTFPGLVLEQVSRTVSRG